MIKKFGKIFVSVILIGMVGYAGYRIYGSLVVPPERLDLADRKSDFNYTHTPTLFIHGFAGDGQTFNNMIGSFQTNNEAEKVLTVQVGVTGKLAFFGEWDDRAVNPVIQVLFENNMPLTYTGQAKTITKILATLKSRYGVKDYNLVAHSWGGSAAVRSLFLNGAKKEVPKLNKMILLGAPVDEALHLENGFKKNGWPNEEDANYRQLKANRKNLKRQNGAEIINVIGVNKNEPYDGSVSLNEAKALTPLMKGSPIKYKQEIIRDISHYNLHADPKMYQLVADRLWKK